MFGQYILKGHKPIRERNIFKWGEWFEKSNRKVKVTNIRKIRVSTVFLGLDHNYIPKNKPLLFETMVFGGKLDKEQRRYSTWQEAEKGHDDICKEVHNSLKKK